MNTTTSSKSKLTNSNSEAISSLYLQLQLNANILAVVPMRYTQEVLTVSSRRITPMPNMPDCILGLLNQKSRIFWVADLSQMFNMQPIDRNLQQYHLAIIRFKDIPLGLIVSQIKGVVRLNPEEIQSLKEKVIPSLEPYFYGYCQQQDKRMLVLNPEALVNSPLLHSI
jgi:twitching motility protein PilI